jgi:hypothetical protein
MGYTGEQITIPLGQFGLISDIPASDIPPNALIDARNISLEKGLVEKAPGTLKYNASALSAGVVGLIEYRPDDAAKRIIAACSDGTIYRDTGDRLFGGGTAIASGLGTLTPNCQFLVAGQETIAADRKLFFFSEGINQLQVLAADGSTFADVATPASDWTGINYPKIGVLHRSRLWAFSRQFAYASATGDHEDFVTGAIFQTIFPGEGGDIRGAFVFKGRLFVFKNEGFVYFLDDSDTNSSNWYWKKLASNFGLSGPHAVLDALNDMLAGNTTGTVTSYSATQAFGDIESADVFRNAQMERWLRDNTSQAGLEFQHAIYFAEKKQAFFTYRSTYKTTNDMLVCIDVGRGQPRISSWIKGSPQCLALKTDHYGVQRPMYGDASGYVQLMDYEDRLEGGTAYEGSFQTAHTDFRFADPSLAHKQKHFDFLAVEFSPEGNWNVSCDVYMDGVFKETLNFEQQINQKYLDSFTLDTDRLAQANTFTVTRPLRGAARRISFKFYNSGSNQSFQIASITVGLRVSGEQASKF